MSEYIVPTLGQLVVQGPSSLEGATSVGSTLAVSGQASLNGGAAMPAGQQFSNNGTIAGGTVNPQSGSVTGAWTVGGLLGTAHASASLGANYTTTSTTAVSSGFGVSLVSPGTTLEFQAAALVANNTAGDGVQVTLYRSTTGIPAAGSAPGGSDVAVWTSNPLLSSAANQNQAASAVDIMTGLTAGTTYYFYLAVQAVTGGTASLNAGTNSTALLVRAIN
jgi:hypothetical protein